MKKQKHPKKTVEEIAIHEAGHAVVALACGFVVIGALVDEHKQHGQTNVVWIGKHEDPLCAGIVAWAGAVAEGVDYLIETGDFRDIRRHHFCDRSILTLKKFAEQMVAAYQPAVDAVARELGKRRRLSGTMIKRLAFRACPELRREAVPTPRRIAEFIKNNPRSRGRARVPR